MLLCLTANHRNASFDLLEALSTGAPAAQAALVESGEVVTGAVVLATCNRFEAYLDIDEPLTAARAVAVETTFEALAAASGVTLDALRSQVTVLDGDDVAHHLFAVTSGLESIVVGEDEIAGQVGRALDAARRGGTTSSALERLFQRASHTSRGVKNRTSLGGAGRSLVRLALELVGSRIADWSATPVLVVGTGQYAATTVAALRDRGVVDIAVFSPSGRGAAFALKHGLRHALELAPAIAAADVVLTCTANLAITAADVAPGRRLIVDLGLPRNVDPGVAGVEGVALLDLETIGLHAPLEQLTATRDARAIVASAAADFAADARIDPAIVALRSHVLGLLETEVARAAKHDEDGRVEQALRHFAGVLLHGPSERGRELARAGEAAAFVTAVEALFGVEVPEAAASVGEAERDSA
ncbi:glutamyl-tRNA reductase [Galbitalea sp. SE-J8]|uniref:glutamyl-tRNA reductase n=1 Tax=Galbitalea sp. SE-J8 TaxID=3054952 RepID=UPI00259C6FF9|nr:glutamyl-tRNA reductase [Galbitalea sp. SE-J8]MDM4763313.1 glutamyl-tRNA reductase [Galbitalea sp. SE-J8]